MTDLKMLHSKVLVVQSFELYFENLMTIVDDTMEVEKPQCLVVVIEWVNGRFVDDCEQQQIYPSNGDEKDGFHNNVYKT